MKKELIQQAFADLKEKILIIFREMMAAAANPKTGQFTLDESSDIWKNTKVEEVDFGMFQVVIPFYIQYIDGISNETNQKYLWARRPWSMVKGERSLASWRPPARAIIPWMQKRGIPTDNETVYRMLTSIAVNGIRPRAVFNQWEKKIDELLDKWLETLFNAILSDLDEYFNK